jgi:hypothetical protein
MARAVTVDNEPGVLDTCAIDTALSNIVRPGGGVIERDQEDRRHTSTEPRADTTRNPTAEGNQHPHRQPTKCRAQRI